MLRLVTIPELHSAVAAAMVCAAVSSGSIQAAHAAFLDQDLREATATFQRSAAALSNAAYPILETTSSDAVEPFAMSLVDILLATESQQLYKALDLGLDAVISLPADRASSVAASVVKAAFSDLPPATCRTIPLPLAAFDRLVSSQAVASTDPAKIRAATSLLQPIWKDVPQRQGEVCLPSAAGLQQLALAREDVVSLADAAKVQAFSDQTRAALKSVSKGSRFRLFAEEARAEKGVLTGATFREREAFKGAAAAYIEASQKLDEVKRLRALGPPKCFTIGCSANYDYDIWRLSGTDDYTGDGLEKQKKLVERIGADLSAPRP